jgi:AcrR family transcriptional regulator
MVRVAGPGQGDLPTADKTRGRIARRCQKAKNALVTAEPAQRDDSPRKRELLEAAYGYVLAHGLADFSLRPLAAAIGSSPRVLLFLFDSKDGLTRALLARARADELAALDALHAGLGPSLADSGREIWAWLAEPSHRALLTLWLEGYARSLKGDNGPWQEFARDTVADWLELLAACQPARRRRTAEGEAERRLLLAVLRGALLDLLATGDTERATRAVERHLDTLAKAG